MLEVPSTVQLAGLGLSDDLELVDAQALLARAITEGAAPLSYNAVVAAAFLRLYLGDEGAQLAAWAMSLKARQSPGYVKRMTDALRALSLHEFLRPMNIHGGGNNK